ncbi:thiamine phosphate synthase [Sphingomonas sp. H39-1-10]|uniref:thiamine phosphate synthase n=1 Tax=Sphingomonas TaxID=13687 RepID=UPI0008874560|nr:MULTISPECIES: thiamine phosphate synthase [Sphingomonas]MDF0488069.1 thiamine phosphate synthase [Sphingomonas pollutisoli]SDA33269.1 thiamine-phosphate pyrophosphorylase [Sphingomonas sp. NFR15]
MRARHPVPTLWLMTDERLGDGMWDAVGRLPRGAGIVFRHYATPLPERRALFSSLSRIARRRGLVLLRAGDERLAGHERGVHNGRAANLSTRSAHTRREALAACHMGAAAIFVSPVFATRSHPGAPALGPLRAAAIGRGLGVPVIALGGMNARRFARLRALGFHGWAAIDAWSLSPHTGASACNIGSRGTAEAPREEGYGATCASVANN